MTELLSKFLNYIARLSASKKIVLSLFLSSFIPILFDQLPSVAADNKLYLYTDPLTFLTQVPFMWNPGFDMGSANFQYIGYLMPLGPFYSFFSLIHFPTFLAQRIWTASLLFFAGWGVYYFASSLGLNNIACTVASFAYMLNPYSLQYLNRISDILLPYSTLGWLMGLVAKAAKSNNLFYPCVFAIIVGVISGTNGSSLVYGGLGPLLWLIYVFLIKKEISFSKFLKTFLQIGVLCVLISLWWMAALYVDANYSINILKFTETVQATSSTSSASEIIRGLGYWFYYGTSLQGSWAISSIGYQEHLWLIFISFLLPSLAILGASFTKWKYSSFFVGLLLIGLILGVGPYPFSSPSPLGRLIKAFMLHTTAGFALRSTDRASPLVILSTSIFLGLFALVATEKLKTLKRQRYLKYFYFGLGALILLNYPSLYDQQLITPQYQRPENLPSYYHQSARYLDSKDTQNRVLVIPGDDTSTFRWGDTTDPIYPGILSRPSILREQLPAGTLPTIDLLTAFDDPFQQDSLNPNSIAPIARLLSASNVVLQSDLAYEIYNLPDPRILYSELTPTPVGLVDKKGFGKNTPNLPPKNEHVLLGEQILGTYSKLPWPDPLTVYTVKNVRPIFRPESARAPTIVDGGGSAIVDMAGSNLLTNNPTILYSGTILEGKTGVKTLKELAATGANLVLTDTNAKQAKRWGGTILETYGQIETPFSGFNPTDYANSPIVLFPKLGSRAQSVAIYTGIKDVSASAYGNQVNYVLGQRPYEAIDGNPETAWEFSLQAYQLPQFWQITFDTPITVNQIGLTQLLTENPYFYIKNITVTFNNTKSLNFTLNKTSLSPRGEIIKFPYQTFSTLKITINSVALTGVKNRTYNVGFSTINIGGITSKETIRTPTDMLATLGAASIKNRLTVLLNRIRLGNELQQPQPEKTILRELEMPVSRSFSISGTLSLSSDAPDPTIDTILGRTQADLLPYVATSSGRAPSALNTLASSAFDNNLTTAWQPGSGLSSQIGAWVELDAPEPVDFNHLNFSFYDNGSHSTPKEIEISTEEGIRILNTDKEKVLSNKNGIKTVYLSFEPLSGRHIRLTILSINPKFAKNAPNQPFFTLPVAISEVGIPSVSFPPYPKLAPQTCYKNLIYINPIFLNNQIIGGTAVPIKIIGTTKEALNRRELTFIACNPREYVTLNAGTNIIATKPGNLTGLNIDTINLDSSPGGKPEPLGQGSLLRAPAVEKPNIETTLIKQNEVSATLKLKNLDKSGTPTTFWFVFGQSYEPGFKAVLDNRELPAPTLIDGFANGWLISLKPNQTAEISLYFAPQRIVNITLIIGFLTFFGLLAFSLFYLLKKRNKLVKKVDSQSLVTLSANLDFKKFPKKESLLVLLFCSVLAGLIISPIIFFVVFAISALLWSLKKKYPWTYQLIPFVLFMINLFYYVVTQAIYRFPPNGSWPGEFELGNPIILIALVFLVELEVLRALANRSG